jgi:uncharacterized protein YbaR (Trm112 family)
MIELKPGQNAPVSEILVEALVCPLDHQNLRVEGETLVCVFCGREYDIRRGVPDMLVEDL